MKDKDYSLKSDIAFCMTIFSAGMAFMWLINFSEFHSKDQQLKEAQQTIKVMERTLLLTR